MKKYSTVYIIATLLFFVISCSTNKDAAINRGYHAMSTKYNVLYNGQLAFEDGIEQLNDNYVDDYWSRLPIEPLKVDELALPGVEGSSDNSNASFDLAEEKAVKAVQKHSMNINGTERNSQIDNAYLLLGKSRYYSQRFVPALEAFNYSIKHYPTADLIGENKVWRAKTILRLNNEELAYETLRLLLKNEAVYPDYVIEDAHTAMAMVLTVMDSTEQIKHHLKRAIAIGERREQTARNLFILGQIHGELNEKDSARAVFQQLVEMKRIPYKYQIHAEIEQFKNITEQTDMLALNAHLTKLINNRDNRPYLDELHYHAGLIYEQQGKLDIAEQNYNKSIHTPLAKQFQQGLSYQSLGDLYFDKADFVTSGAYYDSVLNIAKDRNTKRIRRLKRRRENLDDVIVYEQIAHKTDSILNLVYMSEDDRVNYFQAYIDELLAIKEAEEIAQQNSERANIGFGNSDVDAFDTTQNSSDGIWYFYNNQLASFGQQKFFQQWGNRTLEDNWRLSDKRSVGPNQLEVAKTEEEFIDEAEKYNTQAYIDLIPSTAQEIDSVVSIRNDAYYNLGLIYKEQFKELERAAYRFEDLLSFEPEEKFILPSKYNLYKIYQELGSTKASFYKEDIVQNHSESKYAEIITNPEGYKLEEDENSPENIYREVYYDFQDKEYQLVVERADKAIQLYEDLPILPKFELLRAYAIGKIEGKDAFKLALEYVALNYSNTEEGKKAVEVIETINKIE